MKRFLSLLLVAVCALSAIALTPGDLKGKWESNAIKMDGGEDMPMSISIKVTYKFDGASAVEIKQDVVYVLDAGDDVKITVFMDAKAKGTYTVEGDKVTVDYTKGTGKIDFDEDDVKLTGAALDPNTEVMMRGQVYNQFKMIALGMEQEICNEPDILTDVIIKGKSMTCVSDEQNLTFKKK